VRGQEPAARAAKRLARRALNSLYKIATLIAALERFRDGFTAEAELRALRERARHRKGAVRCPT
jgi:hypothetical protein